MKPKCKTCGKQLSRIDAKHCKNHRQIKESTREKYRKRMIGNKYAKGKNIGNNQGFKKGMTPWNKGMRGYKAGTEHWQWKGGKSKGYKTGYYSTDYKEWRNKVFERDKYICQICGDNDYITAHHIKSFANYPKLRFEISNGQTLCEKCHALTDNYKCKNKK